ncbi:hypothetical protein [Streptomyces olivochromogenes]|uniref:Lipoprotein n=1 Tax=Streptomyces olivochromogenes TaxID=1963 RepID=A0A250VAC8_STROL|nr:hypothetical protein [Streptomyces olivochromogenes]KUN46178.1 hypothetical protein AQJ27_15755 [Streptomyces olivochromogenes]GAX51054.1 hypothetical protein SO3561_02553 [Streptomyces olivochromogenes]
MDLRHTMKGRRALSALAITAGLFLTVAGCGGGGDAKSGNQASTSSPTRNSGDGKAKESGSPAVNQAIAEVKSNGLTLTITSAKRDQGGFVTVNGTVTNGTSGIWIGAEWISDETELKSNGGSLAGASLVDEKGKKKYLILRDTEGHCLCTKFQGGVSQGATVDWFAQFPAPPAGTTSVQFQVPTMPPATLTLSDGE